ncbi:AraC family transcriptional regulator [Paenibacillus oralis]|nr:AraC family transcriptional regulator [Paenibacillus oralis]
MLHYSEPSAFHNAFKKRTGLTPGQYRAEAMKGIL